MLKRIVDTNVAIAANGRDTHVSEECQLACIQALKEIHEHGILYLDDQNLILSEYKKKLNPAGQPGVGDYFYQHAYSNAYNEKHCIIVNITPLQNGSFSEFPANPDLAKFDTDDRKFVAVAVAANKEPTILNATDTRSYPIHKNALDQEGIRVIELCCCAD